MQFDRTLRNIRERFGSQAPEESRALQCRDLLRFHVLLRSWQNGLKKRVRSSDISHSIPCNPGVVFGQSGLLDWMEKENDEGHSKTPRWALTLTEWPPRSSGKSSQYSAHPGRFRSRAFLLGAERSKLHKFGRRRWKRKGGNTMTHLVSGYSVALGFAASEGGRNLYLIWVLIAMPLAGLLRFVCLIGRARRTHAP
jgi:hypothetical protein